MRINWQQSFINPVLDKEFRLRMRTARYVWALLLYLLTIGLLALGYIYLNMGGMGGGFSQRFNPTQSRELFYFLSIAQLVLIAFMTPGLTAGVVSGEREKQTLNILLTTQQSSTTIILSKLFSSLSFMLLVIIATMPVYSIVFLFGGIAPKQLVLVFLFYMFTMFVIGAFGVLFSTIFKRTMVAVVMTYGFTLAMFGATGLLFLFLRGIMQRFGSFSNPNASFSWVGTILGFNPVAALMSIFEKDISNEAYRNAGSLNNVYVPPFQLWQQFVVVYAVLAAIVIWLSIRYIRPRLKVNKG